MCMVGCQRCVRGFLVFSFGKRLKSRSTPICWAAKTCSNRSMREVLKALLLKAEAGLDHEGALLRWGGVVVHGVQPVLFVGEIQNAQADLAFLLL